MHTLIVFEPPEDWTVPEMFGLINDLGAALGRDKVVYPFVRRKPEDPYYLTFHVQGDVGQEVIRRAAESCKGRCSIHSIGEPN